MDDVAESINQIAASTGFSGVVRIDRPDHSSFAGAYGTSPNERTTSCSGRSTTEVDISQRWSSPTC